MAVSAFNPNRNGKPENMERDCNRHVSHLLMEDAGTKPPAARKTQRMIIVGADAHIGPAECTVFTELCGEFATSKRADVGIGPYAGSVCRTCTDSARERSRKTEAVSAMQIRPQRGKDPRKPKRFSWSLQGGSGGKFEIPPAAFFLLPTFSFLAGQKRKC